MKDYRHPLEDGHELTLQARILYQLYLHLADDNGELEHSCQEIGDELGISERAVWRYNTELRVHGLIERFTWRDDDNLIVSHGLVVHEQVEPAEEFVCRMQDCHGTTTSSNRLCPRHHQLERIDRRWARRVVRWYSTETPKPTLYELQRRLQKHMGIFVPIYRRIVGAGLQPSTSICDVLIDHELDEEKFRVLQNRMMRGESAEDAF